MDLVQVDVVGAKPAQAGVDARADGLARQAAAVRAGPHGIEHLGRDDHLVAHGEVAQRAPDYLLAFAAAVHIGRVEEVDAQVERLADEAAARFLVGAPFACGHAVAHAAQSQARYLEAGAAQVDIVHGKILGGGSGWAWRAATPQATTIIPVSGARWRYFSVKVSTPSQAASGGACRCRSQRAM